MTKGRRPSAATTATAQSQRLFAARQPHFPSAKAAAKALSVAYPTYAAHENGRRGFGVEEAHIYGAMFVVSPSWLLGLDMPHDAASDLAKPRFVQPLEKALPEQETREGEVRTAVDPSRVSELRDEIETAYDFMTMLDKAGDGIGGDVGHGVSAVALAARSALDNARDMLKAMEASRGSRAPAPGATPSRACECEVA